MEEVTDLHQARRLIAQLRNENHQLAIQLTDAKDAASRWRVNFTEEKARNRELQALAKAKTA